jgi:antitoxin (DNA-binding transcriptional repressor) of toxin-antitoxin stability system
MNATILDLRRNMKDVVAALDRNEPVILTYRGKKKAVMVPCAGRKPAISVAEHPAFGMWADRADLADVAAHVRALRKGRF